jgi:hypothetical protein
VPIISDRYGHTCTKKDPPPIKKKKCKKKEKKEKNSWGVKKTL